MGLELPDREQACTTPEVQRAEGMLATQFNLTVDGATRLLQDRAASRCVSVHVAASHVLEEHARRLTGEVLDPWGTC
ncbi:ANTAR domain-containing protein [Actinomycetospora lutea]|uniref:ANTAR domain-containing protein n=1 Tax=Actinomycetospora lutea TaxID=663604 RepID=UPI00236650C8|nr:ANTAR domain-containing protein [Actinomycetospora lutea]MDD7938122.1 ANTAR domain-containing protein [Actinomycetospora lutea]